MYSPRGLHRRAGFTLIELLTVVGIIALLIGILVPSLARARDLAKKTKTAAELSAIEKSLEVFQNDYKFYPESDSRRIDPIVSGLPNAASGDVQLMGAHWLVRALAGPDTQGLDSAGLLLKDKSQVGKDASNKLTSVTNAGTGVDFLQVVQNADRHGSYLEDNKILAKDTDGRFSGVGATGAGSSPNTGRFVFVDAFNFPVLYYKASPRAREPFSYRPRTGSSSNSTPGIYDQADNERITGSANADQWDFAGTGFQHGLGFFGPTQAQMLTTPNSVKTTLPPSPPSGNYKGKGFAQFLHDSATLDSGQVVKPVKAEGFILLAPGKDGLYGTDDDVSNFDR